MNSLTDNTPRTWEHTARLLLQLEEEGASATIRRFAREKLVEIAKELDATQTAAPDVACYITDPDDMPEGFDTIIGWLAKNNPALLEQGFTDPRRTISDGNLMRKHCRAHSRNWVRVPAPAAFRYDDIEQINAYPVGLIQSYYNGGPI